MELNDSVLIEQFCKGRVQAFNMLVWRWQKPILNFLYRFLGNRQDAEDVSQTTFIKVYHKLSHLKDTEKFQVWLYQVAANEARDQLRKRNRQTFFSLGVNRKKNEDTPGFVSDMADPAIEDTDSQIHNAQLRQIFEKAMQEIPEEQRIVIIMKIYQDLKFIEIAEILQESLNTVKSRMYYGLKALKQVLQKHNFSEEVLKYEL